MLNNRFSENYRSRTEQLIHGLGGEFIKIEKEDGLEEIIAQLKIKFIKMRTQLAEFENSDFHRMETDRVVRARIDLKGVEDQVLTITPPTHCLRLRTAQNFSYIQLSHLGSTRTG